MTAEVSDREYCRKVEHIATRFRKAITMCDRLSLPTSLQCFPRGGCGDAVLLLSTYLTECGLGEFDYVGATRGTLDSGMWHSHAWLERDGLIVDITADQFEEITMPVIVTADSEWHQTFRVSCRHVADYRVYDDRTVSRLGSAYGAIRKKLEEMEGEEDD